MRPREDTYRLLVLALAIWGGTVALASADGVLVKLPQEELAALALFAFAFAPACYLLDRNLRELVFPGRALVASLVAVDVALTITAFLASEIALLFVGPLALALHVAALDRALPRESRNSGHGLRGHLPRARP